MKILKLALILGYILLVTGFIFSVKRDWAYDDPFITYRYARNLANGSGFVYNLGERTQSTTTPGFTLLLATLEPVWPDLQHLANLIGAASLAVGGLLIWGLGRTWDAPVIGWAGLLLYPTFPLLMNTIGSETPVYLAFCLGALLLYAREKYSWAALVSGLAVLTRPDGILVPVVLAGDYFLRVRRPIPWKALAVFLAVTIPWFAFAWFYFGTPIPATLLAKQHQGRMAISTSFISGLLDYARLYGSRWLYRAQALFAVAGFVYLIWGSIRPSASSRLKRWWLPIAWVGLYILSYWLLGVTRYFWYYAPLVPGFVILVGLGLEVAAGAIRALGRLFPGETMRGLTLNPIPWLVILLLVWMVFQDLPQYANRTNTDPRYPVYRDIGLWLKENTTSTDRIGTIEVGIIGYYAERPMVDFAGILYPEIAMQLTNGTTYEDAAIWAVRHFDLNYLMLPESGFPRLQEQFISTQCTKVQSFSGQPYGSSIAPHVIYQCES